MINVYGKGYLFYHERKPTSVGKKNNLKKFQRTGTRGPDKKSFSAFLKAAWVNCLIPRSRIKDQSRINFLPPENNMANLPL